MLGRYRWRVRGGSIVGSDSGSTVQVRWTAGAGVLSLRGLSRFGCPVDSVLRPVSRRPLASLAVVAATPVLCPGSSTSLSISGGAGTYTLMGGGQTLTGAGPFTVTPTATTTYAVSGTSAAGCPLSGSATVTVAPTPVLTVSGNLRICPGGTATLLVRGGEGSYALSDSLREAHQPGALLTSTNGTFMLKPRQTTTYLISGATVAGCVGITYVTVVVEAVPELQVRPGRRSVCAGDSTVLRVAGGTGNYTLLGDGQWLAGPGAGPFVVHPQATTTYTVSDFSVSGCPFSTQLQVLTTPCVPLKFYNIITPNHDGLNDVFIIENVTAPVYAGNILRIFNRWGREVFQTTNYQNNWGAGSNVAPGVYGYWFRLPSGEVTKGWVEVVR